MWLANPAAMIVAVSMSKLANETDYFITDIEYATDVASGPAPDPKAAVRKLPIDRSQRFRGHPRDDQCDEYGDARTVGIAK